MRRMREVFGDHEMVLALLSAFLVWGCDDTGLHMGWTMQDKKQESSTVARTATTPGAADGTGTAMSPLPGSTPIPARTPAAGASPTPRHPTDTDFPDSGTGDKPGQSKVPNPRPTTYPKKGETPKPQPEPTQEPPKPHHPKPEPTQEPPKPHPHPEPTREPGQQKPLPNPGQQSPLPLPDQGQQSPRPEPTQGPAPQDPREAALDEIVRLTDAFRLEAGLAPLKRNPRLDAAAQEHAERMASEDFFDHQWPNGAGPGERLKSAGYEWHTCGENIARGYRSPAATVEGWIKSPSHRANLLNPSYNEIGIGYARGDSASMGSRCPYWVQEFGSRSESE